jgi:hypothetical protein
VGLALGLAWKALASLACLWGDILAGKLSVLVHWESPRTMLPAILGVRRQDRRGLVSRWGPLTDFTVRSHDLDAPTRLMSRGRREEAEDSPGGRSVVGFDGARRTGAQQLRSSLGSPIGRSLGRKRSVSLSLSLSLSLSRSLSVLFSSSPALPAPASVSREVEPSPSFSLTLSLYIGDPPHCAPRSSWPDVLVVPPGSPPDLAPRDTGRVRVGGGAGRDWARSRMPSCGPFAVIALRDESETGTTLAALPSTAKSVLQESGIGFQRVPVPRTVATKARKGRKGQGDDFLAA